MKQMVARVLARAVTAVLLTTTVSLGTVALAGSRDFLPSDFTKAGKPGKPTADAICGSLPSSNPSDAQECQALICDLREDLDLVTFLGRNHERDEAGLRSRLDGAIVKIEQGKAHPDAYTKLSMFELKVESLRDAGKPKLSAADADFLLYGDDQLDPTMGGILGDGGVDTALACVSDL